MNALKAIFQKLPAIFQRHYPLFLKDIAFS